MSLVISDEFIKASQMTASELKIEIAIMLFQQQKISLGKASELAEVNRFEFEKILKQKNIPAYTYDVEDLAIDLKNLRKLGRI
jgi:predicted HTH domain antitoxin